MKQVRFDQLKPFLYTLTVDLPVGNAEIVTEFQRQPWIADEAGYGQNNFETRYRLRDPQGDLLTNLIFKFSGDNFKQQLIETLYSNPFFAGYWGVSPEKMNAITQLYALYTWDRPGYSIRIHTDDRMHVAQGMIYLIDGDDPDQSTYFYSNKNGDDQLRIPTGHGQGFIGANLNDSWHTGKNTSNKERYSIMLGLRLNL